MKSTCIEPPDEPGPSNRVGEHRTFFHPCHQFNDRFYIANCAFGLGVFANRELAAGEWILTLEGPPIDFAETKRRGVRECMAIQVGPNEYIDTQPPGVFVNHACDPNAGIRRNRHLVALRPISRGEEIFYDYSTTMEEHSFTMACACGSPHCRKVVRDFSTLPFDVRRKYADAGIVMDFILDHHAMTSRQMERLMA